jgi:ribosomal protein L19
MILPSITFSNWTLWTDRTNIKGVENPGVYMLAHFANPPNTIDLNEREIIYIGETCDQSLCKRWEAFHGCAVGSRKKGHSGGVTYREVFAGENVEQLFVAALPVDKLSVEIRPLFIRYIERKLIFEYALQWEKAPQCNRK